MSKKKQSKEVFRKEGDPFRSVYVHMDEKSFKVETQDMGELVKRMYDDADYEFWTIVPRAEWEKLLFALATEMFADDANATDRLKEICEKHGIKHDTGHWA